MAKGTEAKNLVIEKIKEAFGKDYILTEGSKVYVWADDGVNGKVQIAMALTCPKNMVGSYGNNELNFETDISPTLEVSMPTVQANPAQMTQQEKDTIEELIKRLNL